ncbi:DgyrCDS5475 [Dimorphilus gyrociliatus]|uniref:Leucine carboxyl methyltransferase 1 n=1 Tax=Dimorphilus gyrociliatus TaxID=2664684 RepID=A0A7I8VK05_9ANNE|nr:DgyrCDS5475 [Dimorphilus gyrociliatus]
MSFNDEAVQFTNDDASCSKSFAIQRGYWNDPYILYFYKQTERKSPEISIGYYARVHSIRYLLKEFIKSVNRNCQIVSLGAGYDTTYWNLKDENLSPRSYIEVDFPNVTMKKCRAIKEQCDLLGKLQSEDDDIQLSKTEIHAFDYHLIAVDLREIKQLEQKLKACFIDKNLPTLFISECVLVYMDVDCSENLLKWIAKEFDKPAFINYEQVNMNDRFGELMITNLRQRGTELQGVRACQNLQTQVDRFEQNGWNHVECMKMIDVYRNLPQVDTQRLEKLERFDEKGLLDQLLEHYCLTWVSKGSQAFDVSEISIRNM